VIAAPVSAPVLPLPYPLATLLSGESLEVVAGLALPRKDDRLVRTATRGLALVLVLEDTAVGGGTVGTLGGGEGSGGAAV